MKFAAHSVILCCVVVYGGINVTGGGGEGNSGEQTFQEYEQCVTFQDRLWLSVRFYAEGGDFHSTLLVCGAPLVVTGYYRNKDLCVAHVESCSVAAFSLPPPPRLHAHTSKLSFPELYLCEKPNWHHKYHANKPFLLLYRRTSVPYSSPSPSVGWFLTQTYPPTHQASGLLAQCVGWIKKKRKKSDPVDEGISLCNEGCFHCG